MSPICLRRSGHYRAMCELRTSRPLQFQLKHRSLAELVVLRDRHANGREDLTNIEKNIMFQESYPLRGPCLAVLAPPLTRLAGRTTHEIASLSQPLISHQYSWLTGSDQWCTGSDYTDGIFRSSARRREIGRRVYIYSASARQRRLVLYTAIDRWSLLCAWRVWSRRNTKSKVKSPLEDREHDGGGGGL